MNSRTKKRIIVSVTSDLVSDNRVHKTCSTLARMGFDVLLVGRELPNSLALSSRNYATKRMKLIFRRGPLFYGCFNLRLFFGLLFSKFDVLLSNDLDTLPANFLASKLKRKPLVYDSHEFFTEVPELVHRPKVKRIWEWLEKLMVPKLKSAYTVCGSIAKIYNEKYGVPFGVVRNLPVAVDLKKEAEEFHRHAEKIILYQGAVNVGRGLEQAIRAMHLVENARLLIAGDGDIKPKLEKLVAGLGLKNKVKFLGRLSIAELSQLTPQADMGLSIEEDIGLNYRFALPNKLFDYIQARVPVLVTDLPEMAAIVRQYEIGEISPSLEPKKLAKLFIEMLQSDTRRKIWKENLEKASKELTWENEEKILEEIFIPFK